MRYEQHKQRILSEIAAADGSPLCVFPDAPELESVAEDRDRAERNEAMGLLREWSLESKPLAQILSGPKGAERLLLSCAAARALIESMLLDSEMPAPRARLERAEKHSPYLELATRSQSELGRRHSASQEELVTVRVPAPTFALQIARAAGTSVAEAVPLWDAIFTTLLRDGDQLTLFDSLVIEKTGEGAISVALRVSNRQSERP